MSAAIGTMLALGAVGVLVAAAPSGAPSQPPGRGRVVEIRVYTLKKGTGPRFHQRFVEDSLPLLRRSNVDVVAYGPSLDDADSYYLVRSFSTLEERARAEESFYGSAEWKSGPRNAVLAAIENYSTVVVKMEADTVQRLRALIQDARSLNSKQGVAMQETIPTSIGNASDLATLLSLNDDYIRSVQTSDVRRFDEILADDFLCSLPDGSHVDRRTFLQQIAAPATIANLKAHDVNVRLLGDIAIVHARTTFNWADGRPGASRYTDIWARRDGRWVAIAAHVTRY